MTTIDLKSRTKRFGLKVIDAQKELGYNLSTNILCKQLIGAATSIGAAYIKVCRSRSREDFVEGMRKVLGNAEESLYWMELLSETGACEKAGLESVMKEANELIRIFCASINTAVKKAA